MRSAPDASRPLRRYGSRPCGAPRPGRSAKLRGARWRVRARWRRDVHMAVSGRAFTAVGPGGAPVRVVHDGVAGAVYGGVGRALAARPRAGAAVSARAAGDAAPALARGPAVAGPRGPQRLLGDRSTPATAPGVGMRLRHGGVDHRGPSLADALPDADARVAVFVHGLGETDASWRLRARAHRPATASGCATTSATRRLPPLQHRPAHLRQRPRAGRAARRAGTRLARARSRRSCSSGTRWAASWPAAPATTASARPLDERACATSSASARPHLGAPLEKGANALGWALGRLPETRPLAHAAQRPQRRHQGPALRLLPRGGLVRLRPRRVPAATAAPRSRSSARDLLLRRRDARRARATRSGLVGDLLVRSPALGRRAAQAADPLRGRQRHAPRRANHIQLLNHPAVYEQIRAWIER